MRGAGCWGVQGDGPPPHVSGPGLISCQLTPPLLRAQLRARHGVRSAPA